MRRMFLLIFLLVFTSFPALAEESGNKKFLEWHLRDLYYYDNKDTIVQLELIPKLFVRFTKELTAEERISFFSEFSPIAQKLEPGDPLSFILDFQNSAKPSSILNMANKMNSSGLAVASPVFLIENIEAIIEGIKVEPKIVLTADRLYERMKKYGDFLSRKTEYENGAWVFLIDEVKPPLNLLVFTNLIKNDSWVRRAYPRFKFLHDSITASITVGPVSGTVSETRIVTLTIKIFDPEIVLLENDLPEFGSGLFMPIQGDLSIPSTIKYPPSYLFGLVGEPTKSLVKNKNRSQVYEVYQKFNFYALGEWTIHHQPVSYTKNGITKEIMSSGFTLIVNSQIGNLKITDMPFPRPLIHISKPSKINTELIPLDIPSYWFDAWMPKNAYMVIQYARIISLLLIMLFVVMLAVLIMSKIRETNRKTVLRRSIINEIREILDRAKTHKSYTDYNEALSRILKGMAPSLPLHPTWKDIEENDDILKVLNPEWRELVRQTLVELDRRHMRNFEPLSGELIRIDEDIREIFCMALRNFVVLEGS